jgi:hypothetical protein
MVSIEFPEEQTALRFERYLKSGSGRAFAKRHFGSAGASERRPLSQPRDVRLDDIYDPFAL